MKKTIAMIFITLAMYSCSGYFGDISNDGSTGGLKPLSLAGGGTLSDDVAQDQSPFVFRFNGKAYIIFSSDRGTPGKARLWYAEMDATEKFSTPQAVPITDNSTNFSQFSPLVFNYYGTNFLAFIYYNGTYNFIDTWVMDNTLSPVSNCGNYQTLPNVTAIGLIQDATNPRILMANGSPSVDEYTFTGSSWNWNRTLNCDLPISSMSGFNTNGNDYYIASSTKAAFGYQQMLYGDSTTGSLLPVPFYASAFNDYAPFVDPITFKVYFSSDRYGKGNFDLYRYNTLTYDMLMTPLVPIIPNAVYVSATIGNDANSGLTPASPLLTINKAIVQASLNSVGFVFVEAGVYTQGSGLDTSGSGVLITNSVKPLIIVGGYDLSFSTNTNNSYTILDGLGSLNHVVQIRNSSYVYLINLVIRDGKAVGTGEDSIGGGVLFNNSMVCFLMDSTVSNCSAISGGGLGFSNSMSCYVGSSTISGNTATNGGGVYVFDQMNMFEAITNINNYASGYGGAFYYYGPPVGTIVDSVITNDFSLGTNAVIYFLGSGPNPMLYITNNLIGGSNSIASTNYGIYEEANNSGFTLVGNTFITNRINFLLRNFNIVETLIANSPGGWSDINDPARTFATISVNNTVTNL